MTQPAKVQEPSMEEILASIRRIIADDEAKPAEGAASVGATAPSPVLDSAPRLHNVASVAPHPAASQSGTGRGEAGSMSAGLDKIAASSPAPSSSAPVTPVFASASPTSADQDEADVFDLTDEMALPSAAASFRKIEPKDDLEFADVPPAIERKAPPRVAPAAAHAQPTAEEILSAQTASAVESAFNSLASTVLSANSRTLEDLVKEMMRPMLKTWLDDNLPGLVERIVKTEIERVARGR